MTNQCPTCGHTPIAKRSNATIAIVDVATLSDSELRAYRYKTAPYADLQFLIEHSAGLELAADASILASKVDASGRFAKGTTRGEFYRQYFLLTARWRQADETKRRAGVVLERKAIAWTDARELDAAIYQVAA